MGKMMQDMASMGMRDRMKAVKQMADGGMMDPNADIREKKSRSKRGPVDAQAHAQREEAKRNEKRLKRPRKRNRKQLTPFCGGHWPNRLTVSEMTSTTKTPVERPAGKRQKLPESSNPRQVPCGSLFERELCQFEFE